MGTRGRTPKSDEVKKLQGNPGKRGPKNSAKGNENGTEDALKPSAIIPKGMIPKLEMPRGLGNKAKAEWQRVVPALEAAGVINGLDLQALQDYCLCVQRLAECEADVSKRGVLIDGDRGPVKNPALQLAREYRANVRQWCEAFGLTPSSRGRMNIKPPDDKKDEFEEFLDDTGDDDSEYESDEEED
jgi:P27 family predicted phage terminase small subunit